MGTFIVLALLLRIAFNMGVAFDEESNRYLYSGNDPWYHDRVVDHIVETGESLTFDEAINYPNGGKNPNPPLYDWTSAVDAKVLDMFGVDDPVGLSLNLGVAFWGALTVIPVFFIGKQLFGRTAGLWGAFFMAVSAPHIQRSVFGFADHDATTMFFITASFAFLLKAVHMVKQEKYLDGGIAAIAGAKVAAVKDNKEAFIWSALSGVALAGAALTWKGYPYALAIIAVAFGFQLIQNHLRNRDSTAIAGIYMLPVVLTFLVSFPYYATVGLTQSTLMPNLYVLLGMLIVGAIIVPTRDMPSIVVFPALLLAGGIGLVLMLVVFPDVGKTIFTGLGYFEQTKLYTTIAEAQRTEIGFIAANFGFFTFLLAFWAFFKVAGKAIKGDKAMLLMASWAIVAGFMAFAASRFVMNAAPVFVIFSGAAVSWIVARSGMNVVPQSMRKLHGQGGKVGNFFRSLTPKSVAAALLIALFLVGPNVALGLDAGMSRDYESENDVSSKFTGAFGISFDIKDNGWKALFEDLATRDTDMDLEDRPAFMAWWDYGHWATNIGQHPTVADPFQNHYQQAGRFLASESEKEAMLWLSILLVGASDEATTGDVLAAHGAPRTLTGNLDARYDALSSVTDPFGLYDDLVDATGKNIGYFGVDSRMYPLSQSNPGIFYAPVFLANKNPDEFLEYRFTGGSLSLTLNRYGVDEAGNSYALPLEDQVWTSVSGDRYIVQGGTAYPEQAARTGNFEGTGVAGQAGFQLTDRFYNSMYAQAYGSPQASTASADGLTHWRTVYEEVAGGQFRQTALLEYYRGYEVSGTVTDENGDAMAGVQVTFVDEFGAAHHQATTDANGDYMAIAPFGDLTLEVRAGGVTIHNETMTVTREQAHGQSMDGKDVQVAFGDVSGVAYRDLDADGTFSANDTVLSGVTVKAGDRTTFTNADGRYSFTDMTPGSVTLSFELADYNDATANVLLAGNGMVDRDVRMVPVPSTSNITFTDNGSPIAGVPMTIEGPVSRSVVTSADGVASTSLEPGTYMLTVDHSFTDNGVEVVYSETREFTVPLGGADFAFTVDA
ncbi:MAG: carboxypeptidase regulatory-like domain-containing protein [Thermoplasmatota archaeon]